MQTVPFDRAGGPLFAELRSGFANPGSYTLILWERDSNEKAMPDRTGNFINCDDDVYRLDGESPAPNDGRIVEAFVTVSPPPGERRYAVTLRILQNDHLLGDVSYSGETDLPTVTIDLFARLAAT